MRRRGLIVGLLLALLLAPGLTRATVLVDEVSTLAGAAGASGSADGQGPAARFARPLGLALSGDGSFALVADTDNLTVRHLDLATGAVTTLAGAAGAPGSADGAGAQARFSLPSSIAMPISPTFALVADTQSSTVRRIDLPTGVVTTVVGLAGQSGSADGSGAGARLSAPEGLAVSRDGSFALIADTGNHTVRRLDLATGAVTTLAGRAGFPGNADDTGGAARFSSPRGVAISPDASFALVADTNNHTIRRIALATGAVTTIAGLNNTPGGEDGPGPQARFLFPRGLSISADGGFALVANFSGSTIRRIDLATGAVSTLAGAHRQNGSADGGGLGARFNFPAAVSLDTAGVALVADTYNHTIRRIGPLALTRSVYLPQVQRN